jgi:hypothetical protein
VESERAACDEPIRPFDLFDSRVRELSLAADREHTDRRAPAFAADDHEELVAQAE